MPPRTGLKFVLVLGSTNMPRLRRWGFHALVEPFSLGNSFWRDSGNGHRDGRTPRQSPNWWPCASTGQWQFGVDERGKGRLVVAVRRNDHSPAFQCRVQSANDPSPAGTTDVCKSKSFAIAETEGHAFSRPGGTLAGAGEDPALKRRAIVAMSLRDEGSATAKTATGTGALPSKGQAGRPMAVWGGRTGQRAFGRRSTTH
jgi:hypothetical protein